MSDDPVEHAIHSMPPFMQRRMAKLSLAGARFVLDPQGICAWKVEDRNGKVLDRYTHLAAAINDTWRHWMMALPSRDANTESFYDGMAREGVSYD